MTSILYDDIIDLIVVYGGSRIRFVNKYYYQRVTHICSAKFDWDDIYKTYQYLISPIHLSKMMFRRLNSFPSVVYTLDHTAIIKYIICRSINDHHISQIISKIDKSAVPSVILGIINYDLRLCKLDYYVWSLEQLVYDYIYAKNKDIIFIVNLRIYLIVHHYLLHAMMKHINNRGIELILFRFIFTDAYVPTTTLDLYSLDDSINNTVILLAGNDFDVDDLLYSICSYYGTTKVINKFKQRKLYELYSSKFAGLIGYQ